MENKKCIICGKGLIGKQSKYCSKSCKQKSSYREENSDERARRQLIQNKRRIVNKYKLILHLGGKCSKCGYNKNIAALEFHHIDSNEKDFNISHNVGLSYEKLLSEAEKCILLCSNCHREEHNPELTHDYAKILIEGDIEKESEKKQQCEGTKCICGNPKTKYADLCLKCAYEKARKVKRPSKEELLTLVKTKSIVKIGEYFGVSDTSVRKWCKKYDIPYRLSDIKILRQNKE